MNLTKFLKKIFTKEKPLVTDSDFDEKYKIVYIKGFDSAWANIYEINDESYKRIFFEFPEIKPKDAIVLPFSKGVKKFCIEQQITLVFENDVPKNRIDFIKYLQNAGCSDIVMDGFISCSDSDINNDYMPKSKYVKVYDYNGKFIGLKKNNYNMIL